MKTKHRLLFIVMLVTGSAYSVWNIPLPPGTSVTVPLRSISVIDVQQPLPGDGTTDTLITLAVSKRLNVDTNDISGSVQISADLVVRVKREELETLLGQTVGETKQSILTNAVHLVAFGKLGKSIPYIAEGLAE